MQYRAPSGTRRPPRPPLTVRRNTRPSTRSSWTGGTRARNWSRTGSTRSGRLSTCTRMASQLQGRCCRRFSAICLPTPRRASCKATAPYPAGLPRSAVSAGRGLCQGRGMRGADVFRHPERTVPTPQDYRAAVARIAPYVRRTPVLRAVVGGRPVSLKLEHLQVAGVFKIRGALNALLARGDDPPELPGMGGSPPPISPRRGDDPPEPPAHGGLRA